MILPQIDQIMLDAAEAIADPAPPTSSTEKDVLDLFASDACDLLLFEGCQFFPLEEARNDELENIVLREGGDVSDWQSIEDGTTIPQPTQQPSFGMFRKSQLCTV